MKSTRPPGPGTCRGQKLLRGHAVYRRRARVLRGGRTGLEVAGGVGVGAGGQASGAGAATQAAVRHVVTHASVGAATVFFSVKGFLGVLNGSEPIPVSFSTLIGRLPASDGYLPIFLNVFCVLCEGSMSCVMLRFLLSFPLGFGVMSSISFPLLSHSCLCSSIFFFFPIFVLSSFSSTMAGIRYFVM